MLCCLCIVILAGVDLEMPGSKGSFDATIGHAVNEGVLPLTTLDGTDQRYVALSLLGMDVKERTIQVDMNHHHDLIMAAGIMAYLLLDCQRSLKNWLID